MCENPPSLPELPVSDPQNAGISKGQNADDEGKITTGGNPPTNILDNTGDNNSTTGQEHTVELAMSNNDMNVDGASSSNDTTSDVSVNIERKIQILWEKEVCKDSSYIPLVKMSATEIKHLQPKPLESSIDPYSSLKTR